MTQVCETEFDKARRAHDQAQTLGKPARGLRHPGEPVGELADPALEPFHHALARS
jgi:hypothetical protein